MICHRAMLEAKRDELTRNMDRRTDSGEMRAETHPDSLDEAAYMQEMAKVVVLSNSEASVLMEVESALARMRNGSFGVCEDCEEDIPWRRLNAVPWARRCVPCQEKADSERVSNGDGIGRWEERR